MKSPALQLIGVLVSRWINGSAGTSRHQQAVRQAPLAGRPPPSASCSCRFRHYHRCIRGFVGGSTRPVLRHWQRWCVDAVVDVVVGRWFVSRSVGRSSVNRPVGCLFGCFVALSATSSRASCDCAHLVLLFCAGPVVQAAASRRRAIADGIEAAKRAIHRCACRAYHLPMDAESAPRSLRPLTALLGPPFWRPWKLCFIYI